MAIKKSELYSSLWKSCDELRGGMDASQYKDYVLVLLFVKYVSDKYAWQPGALIDVPAGGSFADMVAFKGNKEIIKELWAGMNKWLGPSTKVDKAEGTFEAFTAMAQGLEKLVDDPPKNTSGKNQTELMSLWTPWWKANEAKYK